MDHAERARGNDRVRRSWAKQASRYDRSIGFFERRLFGREHRPWACARATGDVLEVAIGTGLNLSHYGRNVRITGIDISPEMLQVARARARRLGRNADLRQGDAHDLPFEDASFDSVVCTYSLCNIPDPRRALSEMRRVVRPGGSVVLVDHVRSSVMVLLWFQRLVEVFSKRFEGEYLTRRPSEYLQEVGLVAVDRERLGPAGLIERLIAVRQRPNLP